MDFSSISGLSSSSQQNLQRANAKLQTALAVLASGSKINKASDDVASLAIATQLQTETISLKQISGSLAQASSTTQVADGGIQQIQGALEQLKSLAQQATSPTLSDANRQQLNQQFQQLRADIDRIAGNTSFNGKNLLDGSVSGDNALSLDSALGTGSAADDAEALTIDSLSSASLFDGQNINILSAGSAGQALGVIGEALNKVATTRTNVGAFQQSVNFAAASIDSAVANQDAARSILQDTDFAEASTQFSLLDLQRNASLALTAQGNRLSPALLQLIG
jgi:flagellin